MKELEERTIKITSRLEVIGNSSVTERFYMDLKLALATGGLEKCISNWESYLFEEGEANGKG